MQLATKAAAGLALPDLEDLDGGQRGVPMPPGSGIEAVGLDRDGGATPYHPTGAIRLDADEHALALAVAFLALRRPQDR
ncbi:hypothetical protein [Nonomuraea endophytica]|uniref:Uncharacterized protein n=1 Tax=Nonomuraea endophytica TaxID=714136 RepID=A0A7W8EJG9_9ACTN|nr:hypothetical protein [Nonomuraea endophytica]MBB5081506.1 hypothetical protein [Nonomuraea endophytica]